MQDKETRNMEWKYGRRERLLWELKMTELCGRDERNTPILSELVGTQAEAVKET